VLDRRLEIETSANETNRAPDAPADTTTESILALKYLARGVETISTGFDTGSRVQVGGVGNAQRELDRWAIGSSVPCWFNPEQPEEVVVVRGFGGAYLFALVPLPVFLLGIWRVRSLT
jgi:hypothetical protein